MKISVLIPCYNSGKTIEATLTSVFAQTVPPDEILVLNDGSTDDTQARLDKYKDRVMVFSQKNSGVARASNRLVNAASGDMLAFLDHDDIWHPKYLETQRSILQKYPEVVAGFTGHFDFPNNGVPDWSATSMDNKMEPVIFDSVSFLYAYNKATGLFGSSSFCCIRKSALDKFSGEPFHPELSRVQDSYLFQRLARLGSVAHLALKLAAFRLTEGSLSSNRLASLEIEVYGFELLLTEYRREATPELQRAISWGFAAKRRQYARTLLGAGNVREARRQLRLSLWNCHNPKSAAKSLLLLLLSVAPKRLQPRWPSSERAVNPACNQTGTTKQLLSGK